MALKVEMMLDNPFYWKLFHKKNIRHFSEVLNFIIFTILLSVILYFSLNKVSAKSTFSFTGHFHTEFHFEFPKLLQ